MRNHFHLAVETPQPNLSEGMKFLQGTWANRFNRYRGLVGRPFQGRYKALHVEPGQALAQVANYIHLNPVRAKIAAVETLDAFRWSSLWWYPQRKKRPAWLFPETVLTEAGGLSDCERRSEHRLFLAVRKSPVLSVGRRDPQGPAAGGVSAGGFVAGAVLHAVALALQHDGVGAV